MSNTHAFSRRIRAGFAVVVLLACAIAVASLFTLRSVIETKDRIITEFSHDIVETRELEVAAEQVASSSRAYLLTGDPRFLERTQKAKELYQSRMDALRGNIVLPEERVLIQEALTAAAGHQAALDEAISAELKHYDPREIAELFEAKIQPRSQELRKTLDALTAAKDAVVAKAVRQSRHSARRATSLLAVLGSAAAALAGGLFILSNRTLRRLERNEAEIRDLNEHLENRVQERTRDIEGFAYSVAHDLRSPLRAMAGWSEVLLADQGPRLDDAGRESLNRIRKSAVRMDELIAGLLGLARLSVEQFPRSRVDVSEVLGQVLAGRNQEIQARGAVVDNQVPPLGALAHPGLLTIAVDQLISNALKFVAPGNTPRLGIWTEQGDSRLRILVSDNGIGIPPDYHARIFGTFEKLHPGDVYPGVGVGLAMTRRAVERMDGRVGVSSVPGVGSLFWIELEAAPSAAPALR